MPFRWGKWNADNDFFALGKIDACIFDDLARRVFEHANDELRMKPASGIARRPQSQRGTFIRPRQIAESDRSIPDRYRLRRAEDAKICVVNCRAVFIENLAQPVSVQGISAFAPA